MEVTFDEPGESLRTGAFTTGFAVVSFGTVLAFEGCTTEVVTVGGFAATFAFFLDGAVEVVRFAGRLYMSIYSR